MTNKDSIHILSACNDGFAQHFGVVAVSLLENTIFPARLSFHLIDDGISEENRQNIRSCIAQYDAQIEFLNCDRSLFAGFYETSNMPLTTYFRLIAHKMLPLSIKKVIYLDCDLVVREDIADLWYEQIDTYALAAVEDNHGSTRLPDLKIPETSSYFNAGVLLINLTYWRKHSIGEKVIEFARVYGDKLYWQDQDALNAVCFDNWKKLHPKWNVQTNMLELRKHEQVFSKKDLVEALYFPGIIHYTTYGSKPWFYKSVHPYKADYYDYLKLTSWSDFTPDDKTFDSYLIRSREKSRQLIKKCLPDSLYLFLKTKKYSKNGLRIN